MRRARGCRRRLGRRSTQVIDPPAAKGRCVSEASDPKLTDDEQAAWRSFLRAHDHLMRMLDADLREEHDMTISEYDVLVQLQAAPGRRMRMRDLARATLFSRR